MVPDIITIPLDEKYIISISQLHDEDAEIGILDTTKKQDEQLVGNESIRIRSYFHLGQIINDWISIGVDELIKRTGSIVR
tara:strand:+ start:654 stop:893 length:240 start_codon:yes stop_codon:yes gene_type:complete